MVRKGVGKTDVGRVRNKNEDFIFIQNGPIGVLGNVYVIADGMGGHNAGDVASKNAVTYFCELLKRNKMETTNLPQCLEEAVRYANEKVYRLSLQMETASGMGTTFTACTVVENKLMFVHIGDSRIYAIRDGICRQITEDHSLVNELVKKGELTRAQAKEHPKRNMLTRALGTESDIIIDIGVFDFEENDRILLCSDGLYNMVQEENIVSIVQSDLTDEERVEKLICCAIENGGLDNISVILL